MISIKDLCLNFRLSNSTSEYKSLVVRYKNPLTQKRDRTITCSFLKLKKDEMRINDIMVDQKRYDIFLKIKKEIERYVTLLDDVTKFDEDELKNIVFSIGSVNKTKKNLQIFIVDVLKNERDLVFEENPDLKTKSKEHYYRAIEQFELFEAISTKKRFSIHHVTQQLLTDFENFLLKKRKYKVSTARIHKTYLLFLLKKYFYKKNDFEKLTICEGYFSPIKKIGRKKVVKAYLTIDEVERIYNTDFSKYVPQNDDEVGMIRRCGGLNEVRNWIVVGFYTAQRHQTLLSFKDEQIQDDKIVNVYQQKTNTRIPYLPIWGALKDYFEDRKEFPYMAGRNGDFQNAIRIICKIMKLNDVMLGDILQEVEVEVGLNGEKTKEFRHVRGHYERWELITAHTLRRSFITYAHHENIPANLAMAQTGHTNFQVYSDYNQQSTKDKLDDLVQLMKNRNIYQKEKPQPKKPEPKIIKLNQNAS